MYVLLLRIVTLSDAEVVLNIDLSSSACFLEDAIMLVCSINVFIST